jgi:hypothetical protein
MAKIDKFDTFRNIVDSYIKDINKADRRAAKVKASTEKQENQNLLKSKKATLRAKLGSLGINPDETGSALASQTGMEAETELKNTDINAQLRAKLKTLKNGSFLEKARKLIS